MELSNLIEVTYNNEVIGAIYKEGKYWVASHYDTDLCWDHIDTRKQAEQLLIDTTLED